MKVHAPTSDYRRITFLHDCLQAAQVDRTAGRKVLKSNTVDMVETHLEQFQELIDAVTAQTNIYKKDLAQQRSARQKLEWCIRDLWDQLKKNGRRNPSAADLYTFYELSETGLRPTVKGGLIGWIAMADMILAGDERAIAQGHKGTKFRSKIKAALQDVRDAEAAVEKAKQTLHQKRIARSAARRTLVFFCRDVVAELRQSLRALSATDRRNVMRDYGVRFVGDPGARPMSRPKKGEEGRASGGQSGSEGNEAHRTVVVESANTVATGTAISAPVTANGLPAHGTSGD